MITGRKMKRYPQPQPRTPLPQTLSTVSSVAGKLAEFQALYGSRKSLDDLLGKEYSEIKLQLEGALTMGNDRLQLAVLNRMETRLNTVLETLKTERNSLYQLRQQVLRLAMPGQREVIQLIQKNNGWAGQLTQRKLEVEKVISDLRPRVDRDRERDEV